MDNAAILKSYHRDVTKNSAGYDLVNVKHSDGSFDLTPLIIGSQGTLGIVTEIRMRAEPYNPQNSLFAVFFDDFQRASDAVQKLRKLQPSALEIVDDNLLKFLDQHNPAQLLGIIEKPFPKAVLLVEFDDIKVRLQKRKVKKAIKIVEKLAYDYRVERTDADAKDRLWKIRRNATAVIWQSIGNQKALPIIEDGVVPPEKLALFMQEAHKLYAKYGLQAAIWGHAGDGNLHMQPFLDLSQVADRQKVFKIMDDFYEMIIALGGSTSGEHGDGRVRGPYLKHLVGPELYSVFEKVKAVFDPYTTLNPGVKIAVTQESVKPLLRQEYGMPHLNEHMPQF
jgi:FAD/FMN-containing dehydrogenase